jgi:hypothetical protein
MKSFSEILLSSAICWQPSSFVTLWNLLHPLLMPVWVGVGVTTPVLVGVTGVEDSGTEMEVWGVQLLGIEDTGDFETGAVGPISQ